jgi:hypothetical protein
MAEFDDGDSVKCCPIPKRHEKFDKIFPSGKGSWQLDNNDSGSLAIDSLFDV